MTVGAATTPTQAQVDALASGNERAWNVVVGWLQPQLDGFFIGRGGRGVDHEALTQETLLRMSRHIASFTDGGAGELRAWAFAIARTVTIDEARRAAARPISAPGSDDERDEPASTDAPFDEHVAAIDRVEQLLAQLTPEQAELLRLRIHGDLTLEHAAASVGISTEAAKQLQRRALRKLATLVEQPAEPLAGHAGDDDRRPPTDAIGALPPSGTPP